MKNLAVASIIVGIISLVVGIYSRVIFEPVYGLEAKAFLGFTGACLLFAIALAALNLFGKK
ncbi:MAG: hypothetical protein Q8R05_03155 [Candidatus Omnitrophota bacterium]|nr:hypothetical protein [Candidatus Omnitrophota bacterium]